MQIYAMFRALGLTVGSQIGLCLCEGGQERSLFSVGEGHSVSEARELWPLPCVCLQLHMLTQHPLGLDWLAAQQEGLPWGFVRFGSSCP